MDIRDVSADLNRASRNERKTEAHSGTAAGKKGEILSEQDYFENSGRLGEVLALIDSLVRVPEVRPESVERAKALLASGELDGPELAAKAAQGIIDEAEGLA